MKSCETESRTSDQAMPRRLWNPKFQHIGKCEVYTEVLLTNQVLWNVTARRLLSGDRSFEGTVIHQKVGVTYVRAYIHAYIHAHIYICTFIHKNMLTCVHTHIHSCMLSSVHTVYIYTYVHITHMHTYTYIYTYVINKYTHTYIHLCIHTYIHTYTQNACARWDHRLQTT